jgi:hypothetical protein
MMEYKIIRATRETGQIEVQYSKDGEPVGTFAIDVPVFNNIFMTGDALNTEILNRAPVWVHNRKAEVKNATGFELIEALVQPPVALKQDLESEQARANTEMWAKVEFEKQVAEALVKWGVLQSNPTSIDVTKL